MGLWLPVEMELRVSSLRLIPTVSGLWRDEVDGPCEIETKYTPISTLCCPTNEISVLSKWPRINWFSKKSTLDLYYPYIRSVVHHSTCWSKEEEVGNCGVEDDEPNRAIFWVMLFKSFSRFAELGASVATTVAAPTDGEAVESVASWPESTLGLVRR